jgi:anti-anti-sigma regulatory factor
LGIGAEQRLIEDIGVGEVAEQAREPAGSLLLPEYLDLTAAEELRSRILDVAAAADGLVLDASSVEVLTSPCVQILVSASATLSGDGKQMQLRAPSAAFRSAMEDLGLGPILEQWETA